MKDQFKTVVVDDRTLAPGSVSGIAMLEQDLAAAVCRRTVVTGGGPQ